MSFEKLLLMGVLIVLLIAVAAKEWERYEQKKNEETRAIGNRKLFRKKRN